MSKQSQENRLYKRQAHGGSELKKCNHFEENQLTAGNSRNVIQHNQCIWDR